MTYIHSIYVMPALIVSVTSCHQIDNRCRVRDGYQFCRLKIKVRKEKVCSISVFLKKKREETHKSNMIPFHDTLN